MNLGRKGPESPLHALCQPGIYQILLMHLLNELTKLIKRDKRESQAGTSVCAPERTRSVRGGEVHCFASCMQMCEALLLLQHTQRGTEASFFNAFWPWEGFRVLYPAVVWPNSGLEFVLSLFLSLPLPLCLKTELSPSHVLGPEAERKNR